MVSIAHGISTTDPESRVLVNIGDFLSYRAADQIYNSGMGQSNITIISDTSGLTQYQNGKTHQSTGQPGMIDNMPDVRLYEPADKEDMFEIINYVLTKNEGVDYIRTFDYEIEDFPKQHSTTEFKDHYLVYKSDSDIDVQLVGCGLTTSKLYQSAKKMKKRYDVDSLLVNINNHNSVEGKFSEYFEKDKPLFVAYNGSPDFLTNKISRTLVENKITPSNVYGHGFYKGDTGETEDLIKAYNLDSEGLIEVINQNLKI